jgi:glycosyltransferase involved in cell wall biosynthesis
MEKKMQMQKLSIVIPAYNEEKRIEARLEDLSRVFESLRKKKVLDYEVLIVINNTRDNTEKIVKKFAKKNKRILYLNLKQGGKGYAVISGFKDALKRKDNSFIGFVDSDSSTTASEYARLFSKMDSYDGIIASRYLPGSKVSPKPTIKRIIASRVYNLWIRALFFMPYADTQCGAKIFKRAAIAAVVNNLINTKWAFDVDLLYNLRKFGYKKIKEVPTTWSDSSYSKINLMESGAFMALSMLRLRLLNSPLKSVVRLYDKMPAWMKIHNKFRKSSSN